MLNFLDAHIAPLRCRRSMIVAWALMLMTVAAHSQVIIDGKRAFSDSASDIILYCIPQECFGHDFTRMTLKCGRKQATGTTSPSTAAH